MQSSSKTFPWHIPSLFEKNKTIFQELEHSFDHDGNGRPDERSFIASLKAVSFHNVNLFVTGGTTRSLS